MKHEEQQATLGGRIVASFLTMEEIRSPIHTDTQSMVQAYWKE